MSPAATALVFAYHTIGVRCIEVLLAKNITIACVVTHDDNPQETCWFDSVKALCAARGLACVVEKDLHGPNFLEICKNIAPDWIFSFYYRALLPKEILACAKQGAFNLHGALLPKYRGRASVNWAVLHGETETGVTLHAMVEKPDAGDIIGQTMVPILPHDTAHAVFQKIIVASEQTLWRALPDLLSGKIAFLHNDLAQGSYFGGRTPADGAIDWKKTAQAIYNLHRAVAPPHYPGAWCMVDGQKFVIEAAFYPAPIVHILLEKHRDNPVSPGIYVVDDHILGCCGDQQALLITKARLNGKSITASDLQAVLESTSAGSR